MPGSSASPEAWHPSQISRRLQARLLCIRYPVDNKANPDVFRKSTETPEMQSVRLLCSDQSFWKHLLLGRGGNLREKRNCEALSCEIVLDRFSPEAQPASPGRRSQCSIWAALGMAGATIKPLSGLPKGRGGWKPLLLWQCPQLTEASLHRSQAGPTEA